MDFKLLHGCCISRLTELPGSSVGMVLVDPPYGTTKCKWDSVIPLPPLWEQIWRVLKPNGVVCMTASNPFTSQLIISNRENFKYTLVWEKTTATGHLNANKMPMRAHEDIVVFYRGAPTYNPQMTKGHTRKKATSKREGTPSDCYGAGKGSTQYDSTTRYPRSVIKTSTDKQRSKLHPTQKPVALMEYLIQTYTNPGDTVLDFAMGSGTTGVACINTGRTFWGVEKDTKYYNIAVDRIREHQKEAHHGTACR